MGLDLPDMQGLAAAAGEATGDPERNIELLRDVTLRVKVELGRGKMLLREVLRLAEGSVVELEKLAGDPLDIYVNDRLIGKGEVLVLNENFCIRITQIFSPEECLRIKGIS
jgi:flagellar motor switch protein FliN/FliY